MHSSSTFVGDMQMSLMSGQCDLAGVLWLPVLFLCLFILRLKLCFPGWRLVYMRSHGKSFVCVIFLTCLSVSFGYVVGTMWLDLVRARYEWREV